MNLTVLSCGILVFQVFNFMYYTFFMQLNLQCSNPGAQICLIRKVDFKRARSCLREKKVVINTELLFFLNCYSNW